MSKKIYRRLVSEITRVSKILITLIIIVIFLLLVLLLFQFSSSLSEDQSTVWDLLLFIADFAINALLGIHLGKQV